MRFKQKKWFLLPFVLLLSLVALAGCSGQKSLTSADVLVRDKQQKTVVWGVKSDTRLFGLMDIKSNQIKGFDIDIAKAVSQEIFGKNVNVQFVPVTSNTRLPLLKNGNVDALICTMSITPDRAKQVDFSDVYFDAGQALLVKKGSPIKSVKDLNSKTKVIGVQGSTSVENIKKVAPDTPVLQLSDYAQAFTALKSGQGDALTTDNGILYGMSVDDPNYVVVGGAFTTEPYGIAVNKGQKPFLESINTALKTMRQNGTYTKIQAKWFGDVQGFEVGR